MSNKIIYLLSIFHLFIATSLYSQSFNYVTEAKDIDEIVFLDSIHFTIIDQNKVKKYFYKDSSPVDVIRVSDNKLSAFCLASKNIIYTVDEEGNVYSIKNNKVENLFVLKQFHGDVKGVFFIDDKNEFIIRYKDKIEFVKIDGSSSKLLEFSDLITAWEFVNDNLYFTDSKGEFYHVNTQNYKLVYQLDINKYGAVNINYNISNELIDIFTIDGKIISYNPLMKTVYCNFSYHKLFSYGRSFSNNLIVYANEFGNLAITTEFGQHSYKAKGRINDLEFPPIVSKYRLLDIVVSVKNKGIKYIGSKNYKR